MRTSEFPVIIQGGMGVGVSNWRLARAVASRGQLGVVSGTFVEALLARRLQDGDECGGMRRALSNFPDQVLANRIIDTYYVPGGLKEGESYKTLPMHGLKSPQHLVDLTVVANFVEVYLAKEGHAGQVGINYLTKIELPTLPSLYGALLAGVDYVLMGAGIPKAIPGILDKLAQHEPVSLRISVEGAGPDDVTELHFDPSQYGFSHRQLKRPKFIAIVSSYTLALTLARKASGKVDGFVVEHYTAGGHNAPPRGELQVDNRGEPIYGERDEPNLSDFLKLDLPFWLAGAYGSPEGLKKALSLGAQGIQLGTAFAFCQESGIQAQIKKDVLSRVKRGDISVFTDPRASSSGYPFKIVEIAGTLSEPAVYDMRPRVCDLGYLRSAYKAPNGAVAFRCPAEPVEDYVRKSGDVKDTQGRKCLCNGLLATVGHAQRRDSGFIEPPLVTAGNELVSVMQFAVPGREIYTAADVLNQLLSSLVDVPVLDFVI